MHGWNTSFLLGWPIFRCYVSFREGKSWKKYPFLEPPGCSSHSTPRPTHDPCPLSNPSLLPCWAPHRWPKQQGAPSQIEQGREAGKHQNIWLNYPPSNYPGGVVGSHFVRGPTPPSYKMAFSSLQNGNAAQTPYKMAVPSPPWPPLAWANFGKILSTCFFDKNNRAILRMCNARSFMQCKYGSYRSSLCFMAHKS